MKKYYILLIIFVLQVSCTKILDTEPLDSYTEEAVWSNYNMAEGYVYTLYSTVIEGLYTSVYQEECLTKNAQNQKWGALYIDEKTGLITKYSNEGWGKWSTIRAINTGIQNLEICDFTDVQKNLLTGECYFLRAATNFYLVKRFGGIQIIDKVLTPSDDLEIARASIKDSYDFILADLATAASDLPATNDRGRATKGAAYALAMRVALQAGAYLNDNTYYQKVMTYGNFLFNLGLYSLDTYSNLFDLYSTGIVSNENIFVCEKLKINTSPCSTPQCALMPETSNTSSMMTDMAITLHPLDEQIDGLLYLAPTQDLINDYLVTDNDSKEKLWNETDLNATGTNVFEKMYKNRDLRFYSSIVYDSCSYFGNTVYTREYGNVSDESLGGGVKTAGLGSGTNTGYLFRKGLYQDRELTESNINFCYSILRLGEAYLNYAEAALMLGDESTAREYITMTYQKHGGFSNEITATGEDLWNTYKRERNVELTLEGDRYWSLLRWGMQKSGGIESNYASSGYVIPELNGKMHAIWIDWQGINYEIIDINEKGGLELSFSPKRYLFPIPYDDIKENSNLTQNSGWDE